MIDETFRTARGPRLLSLFNPASMARDLWSRRGRPLTEGNCRYDVNCDGVIGNSDMIAIRVRRGNRLP